ncbi:hypothetical protein M0P48_02085 [Candidatus Gracilibacteria bacterium]|nr:hypothetical protein [Candidatus Gracilibacteria bacterium]
MPEVQVDDIEIGTTKSSSLGNPPHKDGLSSTQEFSENPKSFSEILEEALASGKIHLSNFHSSQKILDILRALAKATDENPERYIDAEEISKRIYQETDEDPTNIGRTLKTLSKTLLFSCLRIEESTREKTYTGRSETTRVKTYRFKKIPENKIPKTPQEILEQIAELSEGGFVKALFQAIAKEPNGLSREKSREIEKQYNTKSDTVTIAIVANKEGVLKNTPIRIKYDHQAETFNPIFREYTPLQIQPAPKKPKENADTATEEVSEETEETSFTAKLEKAIEAGQLQFSPRVQNYAIEVLLATAKEFDKHKKPVSREKIQTLTAGKYIPQQIGTILGNSTKKELAKIGIRIRIITRQTGPQKTLYAFYTIPAENTEIPDDKIIAERDELKRLLTMARTKVGVRTREVGQARDRIEILEKDNAIKTTELSRITGIMEELRTQIEETAKEEAIILTKSAEDRAKSAEARAEAAEARAKSAEARAEAAEDRAKSAETPPQLETANKYIPIEAIIYTELGKLQFTVRNLEIFNERIKQLERNLANSRLLSTDKKTQDLRKKLEEVIKYLSGIIQIQTENEEHTLQLGKKPLIMAHISKLLE